MKLISIQNLKLDFENHFRRLRHILQWFCPTYLLENKEHSTIVYDESAVDCLRALVLRLSVTVACYLAHLQIMSLKV